MILSFSEFNDLYESSNGLGQDEYSNGIEVMEALLTVMQEREVLSESEVVTFLDNVLDETGYDLNTEVYESYAEWIADWSQFIDEGINEDESELLFALTRRGEDLLEKNNPYAVHKRAAGGSAVKGAVSFLKQRARQAGGAIAGGASKVAKSYGDSKVGQKSGALGARMNIGGTSKAAGAFNKLSGNKKLAVAAGGAAAAGAVGYGAYKGIKALKARSAAKKAAAGQPAQ